MEKIKINKKISFLNLTEKLIDIVHKYRKCSILINHKKYKNKVIIEFDDDFVPLCKVEVYLDYKKYPLRHILITHLINTCKELDIIQKDYYLKCNKIKKNIESVNNSINKYYFDALYIK